MRELYLLQTNDNHEFYMQNLTNDKHLQHHLVNNRSIMAYGNIIRIIRIMTFGICFEIQEHVISDMINYCIEDYKLGNISDVKLNLINITFVEYSHLLNEEYKRNECPDLAKIIYDQSKLFNSDFYDKIKKINIENQKSNQIKYIYNNFECKY